MEKKDLKLMVAPGFLPTFDCVNCGGLVHRACDAPSSRAEGLPRLCPFCKISAGSPSHAAPEPFLSAKALPRTALSDFVERSLSRRLRGIDCPLPVVREVSYSKKAAMLNPFFTDLEAKCYSDQNTSNYVKFRQRVVVVFQNYHGRDMLVMAFFCNEHASNSSVYLDYLDSLKLLLEGPSEAKQVRESPCCT